MDYAIIGIVLIGVFTVLSSINTLKMMCHV